MYGQLPSTVRDSATIYDLHVANVMISWENEQMRIARGEPKSVPEPTQQEMMDMIRRVREENK
jgi:hypothetical protein